MSKTKPQQGLHVLQRHSDQPSRSASLPDGAVSNRLYVNVFFFKQKTAYEISTCWSSDVCSSDLVFIPLTRLCRDRCHYCTFATVPGKLPAPYLDRDEVLAIARAGAAQGCKEALFTLGDRPEDRWPQAKAWLAERGYESTVDYVRASAIAVLEETGLLPHLNPGVLSWAPLQRLKPVAPSMGMMLETTATRLWSAPGAAHHGSPDKEPAVRLRVLHDAGRVTVPFTTGILIGIGETLDERADSLFAIRQIAREYGHIQEVI